MTAQISGHDAQAAALGDQVQAAMNNAPDQLGKLDLSSAALDRLKTLRD